MVAVVVGRLRVPAVTCQEDDMTTVLIVGAVGVCGLVVLFAWALCRAGRMADEALMRPDALRGIVAAGEALAPPRPRFEGFVQKAG